MQYIDRDPETIRRQTEMAKKEKMELDDEERTARFIQVPDKNQGILPLFLLHLFNFPRGQL